MIELKNIELYNNHQNSICIEKNEIVQQHNNGVEKVIQLNFNNAIAFPGLINSHEHLDYNLLPPFKLGEYANYIEWSHSLEKNFQLQIDSFRKVPDELSTQWGVYKNLLNGVTHVVNHGPTFKLENPIINLVENNYWLHSVNFHHRWKRFMINPVKRNWPVAIHIAEGTDFQSRHEADILLRWNIFKKELIAIHGIALNRKQVKGFEALVWCPASNYYLYNQTSNILELKKEVKVLFGTDSTLTSDWSIWKHLKIALNSGMVDQKELYEMLTINPSRVWKIPNYGLKPGDSGNLVVAKKKSEDWLDSFFKIEAADIQLVISNGRIKLFDESLFEQLIRQGFKLSEFSSITIAGSKKYVFGNLLALAKQIKSYCDQVVFPFN